MGDVNDSYYHGIGVTNIMCAMLQVLSVLKLEKGNLMPEDYLKSFREALAVFQHAQMCVVCEI